MSLHKVLLWLCLSGLLLTLCKAQVGGGIGCPQLDGVYANPLDCRKFVICHDRFPYVSSCPLFLYFDDIKKACVYKTEELVCGPVPATRPLSSAPLNDMVGVCDTSNCKPPNCYCSPDGTKIPGELARDQTPQIILLTFGGAITAENYKWYQQLLDGHKNPNGCPIKATFFVSHEYSSYYHVNQLYASGHEIGITSVSQKESENWWLSAKYDDWEEEMIEMMHIVHTYANISLSSIRGIRAPYVNPGGDEMVDVIQDHELAYDSSIAVPRSAHPVWPYTLDYRIPHSCVTKNCPLRSHKGIWEIPINSLYARELGISCVLADQCIFPQETDVILDFLMENLIRHYATNRAPLVLSFHVSWFTDPMKVAALQEFIARARAEIPDTWFLSGSQTVAWMKKPTIIEELNSFLPWKCQQYPPPSCRFSTTCVLRFIQNHPSNDYRYMRICGSNCPIVYPWTGSKISRTRTSFSVREGSGEREP